MTQKNNQHNQLHDLQKIFLEKGFTKEEFESQADDLGRVILLSAFTRLIKQKSPLEKLDSQEKLESYVKNNFSQDDIKKTIEEEGRKITHQYLKEVGVKV